MHFQLISGAKILTRNADRRVRTRQTNTNTVATTRVGENIFLHWFKGPIKKQVLQQKHNLKV